jgi:hypothetical protein
MYIQVWRIIFMCRKSLKPTHGWMMRSSLIHLCHVEDFTSQKLTFAFSERPSNGDSRRKGWFLSKALSQKSSYTRTGKDLLRLGRSSRVIIIHTYINTIVWECTSTRRSKKWVRVLMVWCLKPLFCQNIRHKFSPHMINSIVRMYGWMDGCVYEWMYVCMYVCMFVWMDEWMDGWMDDRIHINVRLYIQDEWKYVSMYVCV